jgi:tetratricopeptide (TPR) repeat protein
MSRKTIYIVAFIIVVILSIGGTIWIRSGNTDTGSNSDDTDQTTDLSSETLDTILLEEQEFAENNMSDVDTNELQAELPIAKQTETPGEDSLDPHLKSAKELIKAFRIDEAVEELIEADETAERLYYQGLIYAYKGQKENAIGMLEQAKALATDDPLISAYVDK